MYGDDRPEDHNAIKVAAHELKSAISLLSVRPSNLCLPLMTLVLARLPLLLSFSFSPSPSPTPHPDCARALSVAVP